MIDRLKNAFMSLFPRDRSPGPALVLGRPYSSMRKGSGEILKAYSHSPMVRAVANKVASMTGVVPWFVRVGDDVVEDHPAIDFLKRGHPFMDAARRDIFMQLTEDLVGEAAAMIGTTREGGQGEPVRLYAFPPTWISEVPAHGRDSFTIRVPQTGKTIIVPRQQIFHRKAIDPLDPYGRGSGLGASLGDEIAVDEAAARHMAHTLQNNARPDMIISGGKETPLDQVQVDRLLTRFDEHKGARNSGRPFITGSPISVEMLSQSFGEMKLAEVRRFELEVIVAVWGIPPELVGQVQNSNRSTIDAADYLVNAHVIVPRLKLTAAALNAQIAPLFGDDVEFDFISPVQEDRQHNLEIMRSRPGAFMDDEVRAAAGFDPLPNGLGRVLPRSPLFLYESVPGASDDAIQTRGIEHQGHTLLIDKMPTEGDVDAALAALDDTAEMQTTMRAISSDVVAAFGSSAIEGVGVDISFNLAGPGVVEFLEDASSARVTAINETTRERLRSTLADGVGNGETSDQLIVRIQSEVDGATKSRAARIARTEVPRASNFATMEGHKQAGIKRREWLATQGVGVGDEFGQVRPSHDALDKTQVEIEQSFTIPVGHMNSGASAMFPGDFGIASEDINCRCAILPVLSVAPEQRMATFKSVEAQRAPFERQLEALMLRLLSDQMHRVANALKNR